MSFATYTTKYYSKVIDYDGNNYLVNLKLSGGTSGATELTAYDMQPITLEWQGGRSQSDLPIWGSNAIFKVWIDETAGQSLDSVLTSTYKTWQLEVSGTTGLYWLGWVRPDDSVKSGFVLPTYFVSINAVDGLADLQNIPYTASTKFSGYTQVISTVKNCLDKTGLNIGLRSQNNITTSQLTGSTDILLGHYHRNERFYSKNSTGYTYTSCYDVISQLMETYNCVLSQTGNFKGWTITNKNEITSKMFNYVPNTTGFITGGTSSAYDRSVSGVTFIEGTDQLSYVYPLKSWSALFQNQLSTGETAANIIQNTNFPPTLGTKFWSNGTGSTNFYNYNLGSGFLDLDEPNGPGNPNTAKEITTQIYVVTDGQSGTTLNIACAIKLNKCTFSSGSALPAMQMIVKKPNGTFFTDTAINFTGGTKYQTFKNQNSIPVLGAASGVYTLIFKFVPNAASTYNECEYYFTNAFAWVNYQTPAKTLASDYNFSGKFNFSTSVNSNSSSIYFSDPSSYFQYYGFPSQGGLICYNNPGLPTSGWTGYPYPILSFGNHNFTGGTIAPWAQIANGGQGWSYDGVFAHDVSVNTSNYYTQIIYQPTIFKQGSYTIRVKALNNSPVVGGTNPNVGLSIYAITGTTAVLLDNSTRLTSDNTYHNHDIGIVLNEPSALGFSVNSFGPSTQLEVQIGDASVNFYVAYDYKQPHYEFYLWSKLKKLQSFHKYVNAAIRQSNIFFNSIVVIKGTVYQITDYSYDIAGNKVQLQLEEITDRFTTTIFSSQQLPTANGN